MHRIVWSELVSCHAGCNLGRSFYHVNNSCPMHDHDFAEVFWVESGSLRHATEQRSEVLSAGDLLLVRPHHRHELRGLAGGNALIVNVALPSAVLAGLEERYGGGPGWPWSDHSEPARFHLGAEDLAAVGRGFGDLRDGPDDDLARDAFLLDVLARLRPRGGARWAGAPAWLVDALGQLAEPPHLGEGLPALVRLTGKSREHISRAIRAATGQRAIDLITDLRLRWAERAIATGQQSIGAIIGECGFAGRARFNRLFRERFGHTPREHRLACRRTVGA
jgi:AraC family cel operon transcriptional repressor